MIKVFDTSRLSVDEVFYNMSESDRACLYTDVLRILTPIVVENLPAYFHGMTSIKEATGWFDRVVSESRLLAVKQKDGDQIIGFIFIYTDVRDAHIGYLLGESFWGVGYAKELLAGLIEWSKRERAWTKLIGGVDKANIPSSNLLKGLGFKEQLPADGSTIFYTYILD